MSIWQTPQQRPRIPAHPLTASDLAIFASGLVFAVLLGIAASGAIPL